MADETNNEESVGSGNDARLAMLNAINDQNDQTMAVDFIEFDDAGQVTKFAPKSGEEAAPLASDDNGVTQEELDRMAAEVAEDLTAPVVASKTKIKVNGREIELTQEEMIARVQKVESADAYLAAAARLHKEAQQNAQPPSNEDAAADRVEEMRALARAIQMGTEEEAIAAISKLQSRPSLSRDDLTRTVDERLTFKSAVSKFEEEYSDLKSDPQLLQMVINRERELVQAGDTRDYWSRYAAVGNEVRAWRDNLIKANLPPPTEPVVPTTPNKQARKAAAPQVPKSSQTKVPAQQADDEDAEESPASVIAAMAKQRGGPQWMRS